MPNSGAWRNASAVTVPRPLKRCESPPLRPALEPPSNAISPPSARALAPLTTKPRCENSTRPLAPARSGVSLVMRTSLPASARLPLTTVSAGRDSGTLSASLSSAAPVAVIAASTLPVQRPTGVASTKRSMSASGPRAVPSMSRRERLPSSAMRPCTPLHSTSPTCARAARMSSVERSTTISPDAEVNGGHDSRGVATAAADAGSAGT